MNPTCMVTSTSLYRLNHVHAYNFIYRTLYAIVSITFLTPLSFKATRPIHTKKSFSVLSTLQFTPFSVSQPAYCSLFSAATLSQLCLTQLHITPFSALGEAPFSMRNLTRLECPPSAARWRGVDSPTRFFPLMTTPRLCRINSRTTSTEPCLAAMWAHVLPSYGGGETKGRKRRMMRKIRSMIRSRRRTDTKYI